MEYSVDKDIFVAMSKVLFEPFIKYNFNIGVRLDPDVQVVGERGVLVDFFEEAPVVADEDLEPAAVFAQRFRQFFGRDHEHAETGEQSLDTP